VRRPFGAHARWRLGPPPRLTSPFRRDKGGAGPDADEGPRDPSILAPWRGLEACGFSFGWREARGRDKISATVDIPLVLRSET